MQKKTKGHLVKYVTVFILSIFLFGAEEAAAAVFINGGFETGNLTGWEAEGDVSAAGS